MIARINYPGAPISARGIAEMLIASGRRCHVTSSGEVWMECDPLPHAGSGKPQIAGIPLADYCLRLDCRLPDPARADESSNS